MSRIRLAGIVLVSDALLATLAASGRLAQIDAAALAGSNEALSALLGEWQSAGLPVAMVDGQVCWSPPATALSASAIAEALARFGHDCPVAVVPLIDSTNSRLLAEGDGPLRQALLAECQRAGRGRLQRRWHGRYGESLLMSLRLQPGRSSREWPGLAIAAGVATATTLAELGVDGLALKWPNDVLLDDAKLAGILVETAGVRGPVVLGLGLNWHADEKLAMEAARPVAGLADRLPAGTDRNQIAARVLAALLQAAEEFRDRGIAPFVARFAALDRLAGRPVLVNAIAGDAAPRPGLALGLTDDGRLRVRHEEGEVAYHSAQVSLGRP